MENRTSLKTDLLAMNVSWFHEDLEDWKIERFEVENLFDFTISLVFTVVRFITLILAIIVHRAFYKLMKRLPGRSVNQIIFPYMVSNISKPFTVLFLFKKKFSGDALYIYGTLYNLSLISLLGLSIEGLHWRYGLLCVIVLQKYWNLRHPSSFLFSGHFSLHLPI